MSNSRPGFGPPPPPISPEAALVRENAETLERELIFGMCRHYEFYREMRERVCVYDPQTALYKQDFSVKKYNTLFRAVDAYWRRFDDNQDLNDIASGIGPEQLAAYIIDWGNAKSIPAEVCLALSQELITDKDLIQASTLNACRALVQGDGFRTWLGTRAMADAVRALKFRMEKGGLDVVALTEIAAAASNFATPRKRRWENAGAVAAGTRPWSKGIPTSIEPLNTALGGGFRKGQAWLIAGAPGGGKTILANQLMWEFADAKKNVVFVTTEQKPADLIPRTLSNVTGIEFDLIQKAMDRALINGVSDTEDMPVIPEVYSNDPNYSNRIDYMIQTLGTRVLFSNWTEGDKCSIVRDLVPEIEDIKKENNWTPDVIIFDWLGGALEHADKPDRVRFVYQEAADAFVEYCRIGNFVGIMFAQVNQTQAKNQQKITMSMLAESKPCSNRMHGFIGISSMQEEVDAKAGILTARLKTDQWFNVDKSRTGPGGLVKVRQLFKFQRFGPWDIGTNAANEGY